MINRIIFTIISTLWIWVVYGIQKQWTFPYSNPVFTAAALILIPLLLTLIWTLIAEKTFSVDSLNGECFDIEEVNNDFLPNYLGYFFIGIGVDNIKVLIMMYLIIFFFTLLSQRKLFNPLLLLLGYKYYDVTTSNGVKVFLIAKKEIRDTSNISFDNLRRINNLSYIDFGGKP